MKAAAVALLVLGGIVQLGGIALYVMQEELLMLILGLIGGGGVEGAGIMLLVLSRNQSK